MPDSQTLVLEAEINEFSGLVAGGSRERPDTMEKQNAGERRSGIRTVFFGLAFAVTGAFAALLAVAVIVLDHKPDLQIWHDVYLDEEFTQGSAVTTFEDYLQLEDRLFAQLQSHVYNEIDDSMRTALVRYNAGSKSDPDIWPRNWNRTFEMPQSAAEFGVLLLHGYSDSPYSLRTVGNILHKEGAHVLGLRIPGHGTAPSGLKHATYGDMDAAVRLAMLHLKQKLGERPLMIVGYSNGAALAVHYALAAIEEKGIPRPDRIVLFSPEIGITAVAVLAKWQAWIGDVLGLGKLEWSSVVPEYDPFKYGSFAVNAGDQAHQLTGRIQSQLDRLKESGRLGEIPPILAFQSVVDATVNEKAVVDRLFDRLVAAGNELVVFDVNRIAAGEQLFNRPVDAGSLLAGPARAYGVSVVTNRNKRSREVVLRRRSAGQPTENTIELQLEWPENVYSLSHIALPFPPDDPLYGDDPLSLNPGVRLGRLSLRGEERLLSIPVSAVTRQRWNPFFPFVVEKIGQFLPDR